MRASNVILKERAGSSAPWYSRKMPNESITLATFNVKDLLDVLVTHDKLACTARMIARTDADVVALQEVGSAEALGAVLDQLEHRGGYGHSIVGTADDRGIRCALVSRRPLLAAHVHTAASLDFPVFCVGDAPPFAGRIPLRRGIVYARVDGGPLGQLQVFVAHFKSRRAVPLRTAEGANVPPASQRAHAEADLRSLVRRAAEALYVRGLVDECISKEPDARVVVMGDLNDTPPSVTVEALRGVEGESGALYCSARKVAAEHRYSVLHDGGRAQIDHILVTSNLFARIKAARFLNEELREHEPVREGGSGVSPAPTSDSDHAPFVTEFA